MDLIWSSTRKKDKGFRTGEETGTSSIAQVREKDKNTINYTLT
jgi:hypothetical protein